MRTSRTFNGWASIRLLALIVSIGLLAAGCRAQVPSAAERTVTLSEAERPGSPAKYPRTVTDSFGNRTTIKSASRIVALFSSVSDAVFGLGEGHRVVGIAQETDWPPGMIETIPTFKHMSLNVEGILSQGADLIIVTD